MRSLRRFGVVNNHLRPDQERGSHQSVHMAATRASDFSGSVWQNVQQAPEDPILGVTVAFLKDTRPEKINLGVGAYRTEEGKPLVLDVVKQAESAIINNPANNHEYIPIGGLPRFCQLSAQLILGAESLAIVEKRVTTVQCLSGTGSLRVGGEFIAKYYSNPLVLIPNPTWGNHQKIFGNAGCQFQMYRYYSPATRGLDIEGLLADFEAAPDGSVVLLHACAHNPTGVDPTQEEWQRIHEVVRRKNHLPFFDSAYQGFASGSLDQDAYSVRLFAGDGGELVLAQSYAKNMGLYGERVGALSLICRDAAVAARAESQLKLVIRAMYSSPPAHGARIVEAVLGNPQLFEHWKVELKGMADRIITMRQELFDALKSRGTPGDWSHIVKQIGMFTFTGLNKDQVESMRSEHAIYMTSDGRISMAGLNSQNIGHMANAMHAVVTSKRPGIIAAPL